MNLILYAIPAFFALIAIELIAEKVKGTDYYRANDAITSLNLGVLSRMSGVFQAFIPFVLYLGIYDAYRFFEMPNHWLVWIIAFVLYDFTYYWVHRFGHEMNVMWAAHVVHHSSEEYNLTTALRQTSTSFLSTLFYIPMALMGFDPLMLLTVGSLNLIYQFWVHTRHIGKLGWFEWFFITPSNHRVHHAQNPIYIDKNYGGVFILWDRLFGTFQEELDEEPVVFGITGAVSSWNPFWANIQVYKQLWSDAYLTRNWWHKITIWFRRTGWRPPDVEARFPTRKMALEEFRKFDVAIPDSIKFYGIIQYIALAAVVLLFLLSISTMNTLSIFGAAVFIAFSTYAIGVVLENRSYATVIEWLRVPALIVGILLLPINLWFQVLVVSLLASSLILLLIARREMLSAPALQ